jgi:phosphoribosylformimino-5-aminoimidazole carboxamide ribotide isomerase
MLILPAIDLLDGKCVRLAQGDYARSKVYDDDPLRVARSFQEQGAEWVHIVDLDGAKSGVPKNLDAVERVAKGTGLKVEFGGGVRSLDTALEALARGVARVVIGSKLVDDPDLSRRLFAELGPRAVAGIDARNNKVETEGWTSAATLSAVELAREVESMGCQRAIVTDIARDGMLTGPNIEFLIEVMRAVGMAVIQSGGVSSIEDVLQLNELGEEAPEGVIVGRAIYESRLHLKEAIDRLRIQ